MASQAEIDKFLRAILGFESGGDATAQSRYASASGYFGYTDGTWDNFGGYAHAREAPPEVQWRKARLDVAAKLQAYDGDWRKVAMSWYYPDWVDEPDKWNSVPRPDAGNTKTLAEYADLVMSRFTGKAATSGGTQSGGAVAEQPRSKDAILDRIADLYPDVYGLMQVSPEIRDLFLKAEENDWSRTRLQSELSKTTWWKTRDATRRQWEADYAQDEATGDALLERTFRDLRAQASRLGVTVSDDFLRRLSLRVHRDGWTEQMVRESLGSRFRLRNATAGTGLATADQVKALASEYGVTLSKHETSVWTQRLLMGTADEQGVQAMLVKRAKALYPTIADELDQGVTVRDYFDPYVQRASEVLGLNPEEIDFTQTKWNRAIATLESDGKGGVSGRRVPMAFDQWERELRTNPLYGYDSASTSLHKGAEFTERVAAELGYR